MRYSDARPRAAAGPGYAPPLTSNTPHRPRLFRSRSARAPLGAPRGRSFLDLLPEAALLLGPTDPDAELLILDCNDAVCRWGGYERAELLGRPLATCCTPSGDLAEALGALERILQGSAVTVEVAYRHKDGSTHPVEFCSRLTVIGGRRVILALGRDRSAHHLTLQSLYENAQRLHLALYGANAGMWEWNIHTGRTVWSDENYRVLGLEPGSCEPAYEHWLKAVHPDDREAVNAHVAEAVAAQGSLYAEMRVVWPDGTVRWLADIGKVLSDSAGNPERMIGLLVDITPQKLAEQEIRQLNASLEERVRERTRELGLANEALSDAYRQLQQLLGDLRASRDILRTVVDGLDDGLALLDHRSTVLIANQALATIYGRTPAELYGYRWETICAITAPLVAEAFADGRPSAARIRLKGADERLAVFDARAFPILQGPEHLPQAVLHLTDISERVRLEQLAVTNERLSAIGRLAAIVAHEVNTPLQSIQNVLHLAEIDPDERRAYMGLVHDELNRIATLIRRLLDLQRPGDSTPRPLDANALIERTLLLVNGTLVRQQIGVVRELGPELPQLWGRQDHMMQVLLNLLLNAADAMPGGGVLTVRTALAPARQPLAPADVRFSDEPALAAAQLDFAHCVEIMVGDTGVGIPTELHEQIFEMFFTTKSHGSGLGLSISRQIVEQHGGRLSIRSAPGVGAAFQITLPTLAG